jgi:hypothetical protein
MAIQPRGRSRQVRDQVRSRILARANLEEAAALAVMVLLGAAQAIWWAARWLAGRPWPRPGRRSR